MNASTVSMHICMSFMRACKVFNAASVSVPLYNYEDHWKDVTK